jgi:hypothetical protein
MKRRSEHRRIEINISNLAIIDSRWVTASVILLHRSVRFPHRDLLPDGISSWNHPLLGFQNKGKKIWVNQSLKQIRKHPGDIVLRSIDSSTLKMIPLENCRQQAQEIVIYSSLLRYYWNSSQEPIEAPLQILTPSVGQPHCCKCFQERRLLVPHTWRKTNGYNCLFPPSRLIIGQGDEDQGGCILETSTVVILGPCPHAI